MADFRFETVDSAANPMGCCCLALDKAGNPRIAFAGPQGEIKFAQRNADAWTVEEVSSAGPMSVSEDNRVWLQIDSTGSPQIAFISRGSGHLVHGVKRDNWTFKEIPTTSLGLGAPIHITFVLHPGRLTPELRDTPHFLFHDGSHDALGYTRLINGSFKTQSISSERTGAGMFSSAVVDVGSEEIHVVYVANLADPSTQMRHSIRIRDPQARTLSEADGSLSVTEKLGDGVFIRLTSLAGEIGRNCVACFDARSNSLTAVIQESGFTAHETIAPNVAATVPSAAKTIGLYRVAFADGNKTKLAMRSQSGNWNVEVVDAAGGAMPSLAYDFRRNCNIGYVAGTTLKYAIRKETG